MGLSVIEATDGGLVEEQLRGSDEAFTHLYLRFYPRLNRFVQRRTGDVTVAEDISQETLFRAVRNLEAFDVSRPLWPWLKAIASNLVSDHVRKHSREVVSDLSEDQTWEESVFYESGALMDAIAALPRRQKIAVALRYLDDWEPAEVANFLGLTRQGLEQLLFRARRKLRTEYARLSQSAMGIAFMPLRKLRRLGLRLAGQSRSANQMANPLAGVGADLTAQLASSILAVVTGLAGAGLTLPPPASKPPAASHDLAAAERGVGGAGAHRMPGNDGAVNPPGAPTTNDPNGSGGGINGFVGHVTKPDEGARQPEDASITSVVFAQGSGDSRTAYAAGQPTYCKQRCIPVLFRSDDAGSTWRRIPATGFNGRTLLAPPDPADGRLFAMGPTGLQVSLDGGESWVAAAPASPVVEGSIAISPAFSSGDPTILIGTQALLRYDDTTRVIGPHPAPLVGPLNPAFSPQYPRDDRILVGGIARDPATNSDQAAVFTCRGSVCSSTILSRGEPAPQVRPDPHFAVNETAYAFTPQSLFVSIDGAATFERLNPGWHDSWLLDLVPTRERVYAAVSPLTDDGSAGLYVTSGHGATWRNLRDPLLAGGVRSIGVSQERLLVALEHNGIACSRDGGAHWSRRCS